jgi:hypothetical protein
MRAGVTAWRLALTALTGQSTSNAHGPADDTAPAPVRAGELSAARTTELVNVLAAIAVAGIAPSPPLPPSRRSPEQCSPIPPHPR